MFPKHNSCLKTTRKNLYFPQDPHLPPRPCDLGFNVTIGFGIHAIEKAWNNEMKLGNDVLARARRVDLKVFQWGHYEKVQRKRETVFDNRRWSDCG